MASKKLGNIGLSEEEKRRVRRGTLDAKDDLGQAGLRRLAYRAGVLYQTPDTTAELRRLADEFVSNVLKSAVVYMEHDKRNTLMAEDVIQALKLKGRPVYGLS